MASCDLDIILDGDKSRYQIGEQLKGLVKVVLGQPCNFKALFIELEWQTRGSGSEDKETFVHLSLVDGELPAGEHEFEFDLLLENQPLTYQGKHINIDWQLKVCADIPWALNPCVTKEIVIVSNPALVALPSKCERQNVVDCEIEEGSLSWLGAEIKAGIKMFGITVAALFFVIWLLQDSIWGIVISSVFLIVGALMLFLHLKPLIAQKKLGKVNVEIEEKVYWAGDSLTVGLSFCTDKGIRINRITARLVVLETAVTYSIKNRVAQEYQKVAAEQQLVLQQAFAAGQAFKQSVSLVLPDDAMHNFNYGYNTLAWTVELDIDIADWPSWQKSLPIVVVA